MTRAEGSEMAYRTAAKPSEPTKPINWTGVFQGALIGWAVVFFVAAAAWSIFVAEPQQRRAWADETHHARTACVEGGGRIRDQYTPGGAISSWSCEGGQP
jgi:hypothetical protein